ncbi:ectoine hydroxylase [Micromonospora humidisoli]|uniref:Phytanoyl-CoA dioxygenase family protein n=1 Tax=Micromonospora humidisoli TaxID=2807622 RepID=A0ABS2JBX9_9ACTN|nr:MULTISPECIES: phytanoyl-CoA dioxygenase family protein [Micromonospora]MBM7083844.1 phytanoyl-CoA dioxygenase family protein [Micromonospora humidisoli]GHJ06938.1 ectoine hydroxylase [Micromonospora sp. AKA109]
MAGIDAARPSAEPTALTAEMVADYHRDGFLLLPAHHLPADLLAELVEATPRILAQEGPQRVLERDGVTVRSVYGPHRTDPVVARVSQSAQLAGAARQLLGDEVYVHQSKVNLKAAFAGDQWEWHQDYINWRDRDGIPTPDLVNVTVFLDEVNEFNGPLTFIPGSHRHGLLAGTDTEGMPAGYEDGPNWLATLTATEKFQVDRAVIRRLANQGGLVSPKGPAGSVLMFHPNVLHASSPNLSPFDRAMLLMVYNGVRNAPRPVASPRPDFLAEREVVPIPLAA